MIHTITAIARQDDIGEIFHLVRGAATDHGATGHSYHFTPIFRSQTSPDTVIELKGFTPQVTALYQDQAFRATDPTPDYMMQRGEPLLWTTAIRNVLASDGSKGARKFYAIMESHGLLHGLAIPLYGPRSRNAFAYFGFAQPITDVGDPRCVVLQALMQAAHLRICLLLDRQAAPITLSGREQEVLEWIAHGKSNTDIAGILKISPDTVSTYVKRVFDKLDSRDRVGATIKALQLGLITL